jgi:F0F1-type ATP synthase membrane subunit b/b'
MIGYIGFGLLALAFGTALGYLVRQNIAKKQLSTAEGQAAKMLAEAEVQGQRIDADAKNQAVQILEEAKKKRAVTRGKDSATGKAH